MNRVNVSGIVSRRAGRGSFVLGIVAAMFPLVAAAQPPGPSGFNTSIFSAAGDTKTGFSVTSFGDTKIGWAQSGSTTVNQFQIGVSGTYGSPPNAWDMTSGTTFSIPVIGSIKNLQSLATVPVDTVIFFPFNGVQYLSLGTSGTELPVLFGQQWNLILDTTPATFDIDLPIYNFNSGTYQSTFGNTINTMTIVAPVPEPATCAMALVGLACGGFSVWRRRKRHPHGRSFAIAASLAFVATFLTFAPARAAPLSFVSYTTTSGLGSDMVYGVYSSGNAVYAATLGGVSISTDGGANWTNYTITNGLGSNSVYGIFANGSTVYAATAGGVGISTNSGVNWTNYTTANGLGANDVYSIYASDGAIYAATSGGLSISINGGANWTNRTTANGLGINAVNGVFASGSSIYAATGGGLGISTDGGANFTNYTTINGLVNNFVRSVSTSGGSIYAGTSGGMSISNNGGVSWASRTTANGLASNTVYGVYASGSSVYASTSGGLGISTNGGSNWTNYTTANGLGSNTVLNAYASENSVYVATFGGGVGITPAPVPEPSTYAMALAGIACGGFSMLRRRKRA